MSDSMALPDYRAFKEDVHTKRDAQNDHIPLAVVDAEGSPSLVDGREGAHDMKGASKADQLPTGADKTTYSRTLTPTHQTKKDLYLKLDDILITALHGEYEVYPGATVDRLVMVNFLSTVVVKHIPTCPDLEKIMCLRDTVLTARVKRAFPEVEYKRKQIRQDHFRKAWLYVNIRKKPKIKRDKQDTSLNHDTKSSIITSGTWTPESASTANTSKPRHRPKPLPSRKSSKETKASKSGHEKQKSPINDTTIGLAEPTLQELVILPSSPVSPATDYNSQERSAVVLDNYSIAKWVKSHYVEDNTSYVPVQDVVKKFKQSFGVDITYKECHQMIYSAFTSPRQRTCPLKTVRVSSMGAQYVYRGIAPAKQDGTEDDTSVNQEPFQDDVFTEPTVPSGNMISEEREEIWQNLARELKSERNQAITERNQALSALMDLENEYAQAMSAIERLQNEARKSHSLDHRVPRGEHSHSKHLPESSASKAEHNMLSALAPPCERCAAGREGYEYLKEERDDIWRQIFVQYQMERDEARNRLEVVKKERDCYLERLHGYEKENQKLRDAVHAGTPSNSKGNTRPLPSAHALNKGELDTASRNGKEDLDSVLSRLRSKRKQSTPTKFKKIPRLSSDHMPGEVNDCHGNPVSQPADFLDSSRPESDDVISGNDDEDQYRAQAPDMKHINSPRMAEAGLDANSRTDSHDMLLFFEGSDMVAFKPHPMED